MDSLDPVSLYFREIRKSPPLSHPEFLKIWKKFKEGEKAAEKLQKSGRRLGEKSRKELQKTVREGEEAKSALVTGNLRLVIPIAKRYYRPGSDFIDLIEEGNIGLIHALKKFNAHKGFRFSTYASYWIDQSVRRSIQEQSKTIRIPPHAWEALRKWFKEWENLTVQLGRSPTLSEMANRLNLTARQVKGVMEAVEASRGIGSLDLTLDEDDNLSLKDIISDKSVHEPDKVFSVLKLHDEMEAALSRLPKREKDILALRFGIDGEETCTLDEVGKKYKISRERVRQIQERALFHLKQITQRMGLG
ncbi:MAG: sigma-70 family RNA polymerase sigma factor [Elusimicrobia bacterium]|nr:sigma-70 family RNA polymerase sigma factor [Elusimicrobiota bacterium]MBI2915735.1 sigma-70 family RNA polymerase sigma factor [Elusimicrobiota bacterium]MBI3012210.1 sigma-70 family RNA polymerase sigma factor [Elusimicrobiota bacterium]